jgi:N-acetylmuramoyl-L-alanine amidase
MPAEYNISRLVSRRLSPAAVGRAFLAACLLAGSAGAARSAVEAVATDVRVGIHAERTRFVLELDKQVSFKVFTLADPYRVVIDLPEVGWRLPQRPLPGAVGVFKSVRYGLFKPGQSRVVLDVGIPVAVDAAFLLEPAEPHGYRLVVDLSETSEKAFLAGMRGPGILVDSTSPAAIEALTPPADTAAKPGAPAAKSAPPREAASAARKKEEPPKDARRVIVVDPGHGGVDPGTIGASGMPEKHVNLAMAEEIRSQLEASRRYRVVLTRDRDTFVRLRDRIAIAREAGAELFISVHADAIKNRAIRGPSVYTLSETASDQEAAELADRENKADLIAGIDLSNETAEVASILIDLAQRETMNESARFAAQLVEQLGAETDVLRNGHRFAGFAVLKAPDVPSVLFELGFLSNADEEKRLKSKKYRVRIARALLRAVDGYFGRVEEAKGK